MPAGTAANSALASGKTRGAAAQRRVNRKIYSDVSGAKPNLHPKLQKALDSVPAPQRAPWHGNCAGIGCIDQALKSGINPSAGTSRAINIGKSGSGHGTYKQACGTCRHVLEQLGIKF